MRSGAPDVSSLAAIADRLSVLLEAGVPPSAGWGYLESMPAARTVVAAIGGGASVADAICAAAAQAPRERAAWNGLAAAWTVATEAGAPLAPTLHQFAGTLRDLGQAQREIGIALAAPTLTARLVLALPLVGIVFGMILGFDTLGVLFATPTGWACIGVGAALLAAASRWNRLLVRKAQPRDLTPGLSFDLVAIAVMGGASLDRAVRSSREAAQRYGIAAVDDDAALADVLELSRRAGVPAAALLRAEALERRRAAFACAQADARALGVRLMIPLGVCVLPAFMVVSVVPMVLAVLKQTTASG